ncbi:MAG: hypothetical protein PF508_05000 [Spirochaeta sp.]|jgi:hypothetical protein|nr:hypothetical protein [Spirochaeta sp.]
MKRIVLFVVVLTISIGTVWAQFGSQPSGFSSYSSDNLDLSFYYPDGWVIAEQDGNLTIANREELLTEIATDVPDIRPGDTAMVIGIMPTFFMMMMGIPTDDISTILDGMFETVVSDNDGVLENTNRETLEFGGRRVATVTFDDSSQDASGTFLVAHEQEDVIMFAVAYGFRASLEANREQLGRLVASAEFTGDLENMMPQ